jgi:hypothetical protein
MVGKSPVKLHPDFPQQEPAAILLDHATVGVQNDAVVEVGSELAPEDLAEPDIFPTSFLIVLPNPPPDRFQSGWLWQIFAPSGKRSTVSGRFRRCGEERVRSVVGHDPNERPEPAPLTVFDLAHGVVVFALVGSFGFSESVFQFGGIGVEGVYDSLKPPIVAAGLQPPLELPKAALDAAVSKEIRGMPFSGQVGRPEGSS